MKWACCVGCVTVFIILPTLTCVCEPVTDPCVCAVQETTLYGATVKINEPMGVIGIACPDVLPLLGFVSLFAPAVVRGNAIVIVPSETHPLLALDLYQVRT